MELDQIINAVSDEYTLYYPVLGGNSRLREISEARQVYCFLAVEHTSCSLTEIGAAINRSHATVSHSVKLIRGLLGLDKKLTAHVENIRKALNV